ncbi:hypothetical protein ACJZ2D_006359 [Fusarium nematophilum]
MRAQRLLVAASLIGETLSLAALFPPVLASAPAGISDFLRSPIVINKGTSQAGRTSGISLNSIVVDGIKYGCKYYIGDDCWLKPSKWQQLNSTVEGRLVVNIPPGAPYYNTFNRPLGSIPTRDEAAYAIAQANFGNKQ